tara:strand:- start:184 stop:618 length:435 start_codon:yes stop_codon:yes gene_type:complete
MDRFPESIAPLAQFLEGLQPDSLHSLGEVYDEAVQFTDPLNQATGLEQLREVYVDLFRQLEEIRMTLREVQANPQGGFLLWTMDYRFRRKPRTIQGVTHALVNRSGRVTHQSDYWDASFPVYGEFPVVRTLMKAIRRMVRVHGS